MNNRARPIPGIPNYSIDEVGNIWGAYKRGFMKSNIDKDGYPVLKLTINKKRHTFGVHRLLALTFIPNPLGLPQVNHKDGNKANHLLSNLEWCTASYNKKHAFQTGLQYMTKGWDNPCSALNKQQVAQLIRWRKNGDTLDAIARRLDISAASVSRIAAGKTFYYEGTIS